MPISQDRVIELLSEAEAHREALLGIRRTVADLAFRAPYMPGENIAAELSLIVHAPLPRDTQIAIERYHFKRFARANDRNRAKMQRRRGGFSSQNESLLDPQTRNREVTTDLEGEQRILRAAAEWDKAHGASTPSALPDNTRQAMDQITDPSKPKPGVPTLDELKKQHSVSAMERTHTIKQGNMTIERVMEPIPEPDPDADLL